jgi:sulfur carrier protein ThiS
VRLHLGGHLAWYDSQRRSWLEVHVQEPTSLPALAARLSLPMAEIAVAAVNGTPVPLADVTVVDGDRLELYPPIGGG